MIVAGARCGDGIDNDFDGRIDTDDADCDGVDPVATEPTISIGAASVVEGDTGKPRTMQFPVTLSEPSTSPVTVNYTIESDGTASAADFKPKTGVLTFKPNARTGSPQRPSTCRFRCIPTPKSRATRRSASRCRTRRRDTRCTTTAPWERSSTTMPALACRYRLPTPCIVEGDAGVSATATNTAQGPDHAQPSGNRDGHRSATVAAGSAAAGSDIKVTKPKTITFMPGQWQKTITVPVYPDTVAEGVETALVHLTDPSTGLTIGRADGVVLIIDDD